MKHIAFIKPVPNRPAITDVLIKAIANPKFRAKLLASSKEALEDLNLSPDDVDILLQIQGKTLQEYAHQLKIKLQQ